MYDKADWGVLVKQFLQNKDAVDQRKSELEWLQRRTGAKETVSGEKRSKNYCNLLMSVGVY